MSSERFRALTLGAILIISLFALVTVYFVLEREQVDDRTMMVLTAVLAFLGPTVIALLNLLKTDRLQADVLNGPMRENIKKAISEDRHDKISRETASILAQQLQERYGIKVTNPAPRQNIAKIVADLIEEHPELLAERAKVADMARQIVDNAP